MYTKIKTDEEIDAMRKGGSILRETLNILETYIKPGATLSLLGNAARAIAKDLGAEGFPFEGYGDPPFPGVICLSLNDEIVHGLPGRNISLRDGDLLGIDFGVIYKGMITDSARTIFVGEDDEPKEILLTATHTALWAGIQVIKDGVSVLDISEAIAASHRDKPYSSVFGYGGHGVGHELHEKPHIPNSPPPSTWDSFSHSILRAGMTVCLEPMLTMGGPYSYVGSDKWAVKTEDTSLAAHFEHTVLVTETGYEVLT